MVTLKKRLSCSVVHLDLKENQSSYSCFSWLNKLYIKPIQMPKVNAQNKPVLLSVIFINISTINYVSS